MRPGVRAVNETRLAARGARQAANEAAVLRVSDRLGALVDLLMTDSENLIHNPIVRPFLAFCQYLLAKKANK